MKQLKPQMQVGTYTLVEKLGEGTSGIVWKVEKARKAYAIKFFKPGFEAILKEEFRLLQKLDHPSIIDEHEIGTWKNITYTVFDYIEGVSMNQAKVEDYSAEELENMVKQMAEGLLYAHSRKPPMVHRDLKPANIMIMPGIKIKILDFGASGTISYNPNEQLVGGSYSYMAPAQLLGIVNLQNDIWGFGVTLYTFFTGHHPYQSRDLKELSRKMALTEIEPPNHVNERISSKLSYIILKCLRKNVRDRYTSFQEILDDLEQDPTQDLLKKYKHKKNLLNRIVRMASIWRMVGIAFLVTLIGTALLGIVSAILHGTTSSAYSIIFRAFTGFGILLFLSVILSTIIRNMSIGKLMMNPILLADSYLLMDKKTNNRLFNRLLKNNFWRKQLTWNTTNTVDSKKLNEYLMNWTMNNGHQKLAHRIAQKVLKKDQKNLSALSVLLGLSYKGRDLDAARNYCQSIMKTSPNDIAQFFYQQHFPDHQLPGKTSNQLKNQTEEVGLAETIKKEIRPSVVKKALVSDLSKTVFETGKASVLCSIDNMDHELFLYDHFLETKWGTSPFRELKVSKNGRFLKLPESEWERLDFKNSEDRKHWQSFLQEKVPPANYLNLIPCKISKMGMKAIHRIMVFDLTDSGMQTRDANDYLPGDITPNHILNVAAGGALIEVAKKGWISLVFEDPAEQNEFYNRLLKIGTKEKPVNDRQFLKAFRPTRKSFSRSSDSGSSADSIIGAIIFGIISWIFRSIFEGVYNFFMHLFWKFSFGRSIINFFYRKESRLRAAIKSILPMDSGPIKPLEKGGVITAEPFKLDSNKRELWVHDQSMPFKDIKSIDLAEKEIVINRKGAPKLAEKDDTLKSRAEKLISKFRQFPSDEFATSEENLVRIKYKKSAYQDFLRAASLHFPGRIRVL